MLSYIKFNVEREMSVGFQEAIEISKSNAKILLPKATNFELEGVILNDKNDFEVTLSYIIDRSEQDNKKSISFETNDTQSGIGFIMAALARKKEEKIFIVNGVGQFKGFKNVK